MRRHALQALEFERVLDIVAGYATSEPGADAVRYLWPSLDPDFISQQLDEVNEMVSWLMRDPDWAPPLIPDLARSLELLAIEGSVWTERQLTDGLRLLNAAREARRSLLPHSSQFTRLGAIAGGLLKNDEILKRLSDSLDEDSETLKDGASPELKRLRHSIRSTRVDLIELLEEQMKRMPERIAVPDGSVTLRNGRYCIPIRREGRSEIGGIVHDESASRVTLFVEPPAAIETMNRLRELELAEAREVGRILAELTDALRPHADDLADTLDRLVRIDSLFARGRFALERNCARPQLVDRNESGFRIFNGRHPLLLETPQPVVAFELIMHPGEHTLLITGPNAGGKTVLIKAIGLISAMTQAGILPLVGPGTELPVYSGIFADIGDEQSIDASLSTFTAHLKNITEILDSADGDALCLIDEIGGATDPVEGTALARSVLVELADRGCLTLATSHLGGLKTLPGEHSAIVSAGLGFDTEKLEPLYKLIKGRPGRSYTLAMAQRVGFPQGVIDAARASLSKEEVDTERLLAELEAKEAELESLIAEVSRREKKLGELEATLVQQAGELEDRQGELEAEGRRQAREFLLEARRQVNDVLAAKREEAEEARSRLEATLRDHTRALTEAVKRPRDKIGGAALEVVPGDRVWVDLLSREGKVVERRGDDFVVEIGGVKLQLAPGAVAKTAAPEPAEKARAYVGPETDARPEVDFRGMTADEARMELIRAVDAAVLAGLPQLRIVHGKGTGVLRATVAEYVKTDTRVRSYFIAPPHEGGSGVTVLELE